MRVVCADGTTFECRSYEVVAAGVVLFGDEVAEGAHRYSPDREQIGFVPHDGLRYILPDGVEPATDGPSTGARQPPGPSEGRQQRRRRTQHQPQRQRPPSRPGP